MTRPKLRYPERVDTSDLPKREFIPLDCRKREYAHLVCDPNKKIITLGNTPREFYQEPKDD